MLFDRCEYFREEFPFLQQLEGSPELGFNKLEEVDNIDVKPFDDTLLSRRPYSISIDNPIGINNSYTVIGVQEINGSNIHINKFPEQSIDTLPVPLDGLAVGEVLPDIVIGNLKYFVEIKKGFIIEHSNSRGLNVIIRPTGGASL